MSGFGRETAREKVAVGAGFKLVAGQTCKARKARKARKASPVGLEEALEGTLGGIALTIGEGFRKRCLDVFFGEPEEAKAPFDASGTPTPALGARAREVASERGVVDVAPLSKIQQGFVDLVGLVAGPDHLLGELALAMSAARQSS